MNSSKRKQISQHTFDALVKENMDDLGMELDEALEDAIQTLQLQGVDLDGIITEALGSITSHPVVEAVREVECATSGVLSGGQISDASLSLITKALEGLLAKCKDGYPDIVSIAGRYGGVEACISVCNSQGNPGIKPQILALKTLNVLMGGVENREKFRRCDGPEMVMRLLSDNNGLHEIKLQVCTIISASAIGDELMKEKYMDHHAAEFLTKLLKDNANDLNLVVAILNAFCSLVAADDNRVIASKAFSNARIFAENGMVEAILATCGQQNSTSAVAACSALTSLAVNEVICKSIAEQHGINFVLQALDDASKQQNKAVARSACSLLSQLAGSDDNKDLIVSEAGFEKLVRIMSSFSDDPQVLQETFSVVAALVLRSPINARKAVQAGSLDMVADAMESHSSAVIMQRQACQMLRNLAARSPENRSAILDRGLELRIRSAKANHTKCKDAASDALRDLGFENYNY